jgi:hypothetical protein
MGLNGLRGISRSDVCLPCGVGRKRKRSMRMKKRLEAGVLRGMKRGGFGGHLYELRWRIQSIYERGFGLEVGMKGVGGVGLSSGVGGVFVGDLMKLIGCG